MLNLFFLANWFLLARYTACMVLAVVRVCHKSVFCHESFVLCRACRWHKAAWWCWFSAVAGDCADASCTVSDCCLVDHYSPTSHHHTSRCRARSVVREDGIWRQWSVESATSSASCLENGSESAVHATHCHQRAGSKCSWLLQAQLIRGESPGAKKSDVYMIVFLWFAGSYLFIFYLFI